MALFSLSAEKLIEKVREAGAFYIQSMGRRGGD